MLNYRGTDRCRGAERPRRSPSLRFNGRSLPHLPHRSTNYAPAAPPDPLRHAQRGPRIELQRSAEHTSELQSLMRTSYAVFCLKKKNTQTTKKHQSYNLSSENKK